MIPSSVGGVFLLANCYAQVNYLLNVPNWMIYFELNADTPNLFNFTHFAWRWWNHYEGVICYAKEKKLVLVAMVAWWEIANMSSQFANAANRPEYLHNKFTCLVSWLANFWPGNLSLSERKKRPLSLFLSGSLISLVAYFMSVAVFWVHELL